MALADLLERGFFPKELPRPFNTKSFAHVAAAWSTPPADFGKAATKGNKMPSSKLGRYSHARGGLFRRQLSISNPLLYFHLSREVIANWALIAIKAGGTSLSATTPVFTPHGRAINGKWTQGQKGVLAQKSRVGSRYALQTDVSRCYNSIYTHSIPWALHGKPAAKANHSLSLLGNRLDYWVRMGQDQQTVGIPIGPDTSLVMAELIMQRCDEALLAKIPGIKGFRYIDDYELCLGSRTEAEDAYHILEGCLSDYELALNAKKTKILELPLTFEASWAVELKRQNFRTTSSGQAADLVHFFNRAYELYSAHPDDAVLQFAIACTRFIVVHAANWQLYQRLLFLCVTPEPASLPYALEQIIVRKNAGAPPILPELEEILNKMIAQHAPLRHSSEVANAAWACLALGIPLGVDAVKAISQCDDSTVALLALDCEAHGLLSTPLNKTLWLSRMTTDDLYDEHWLLAYEANIKGWLPSASAGDHVAADPNFGLLKACGISFYDKALAFPPPTAQVPLPTLPGSSLQGLRGYY